MSEKPIIILGMHRSGTSCLAGSLQGMGLYLGEVHESSPYNLKGNRENQRIMDLNTSILQFSGGGWDNPPDNISWDSHHVNERNDIIDILSKNPANSKFWGFKDPRTIYTLHFWIKLLPVYSLVCTFRHPVSVANSLMARNNFSLDSAINLWLKYNKKLLTYIESERPFLLCFDVDKKTYLHDFCNAADSIGINCNKENQNIFYDDSLRHHNNNESNLCPDDALEVYEKLLSIYSHQ